MAVKGPRELELEAMARCFVTREGAVVCCSCVSRGEDGRAYLVVCVPEGRPGAEEWRDEGFRHSCRKEQFVVPLSAEILLAVENAIRDFARKKGAETLSILGTLAGPG